MNTRFCDVGRKLQSQLKYVRWISKIICLQKLKIHFLDTEKQEDTLLKIKKKIKQNKAQRHDRYKYYQIMPWNICKYFGKNATDPLKWATDDMKSLKS